MTFENLNLEKQGKGEKISQKEASEELSQLTNTKKVLANITQTGNPELSKKLKNTNIQNDVLKFIELSVNNKLASHLSEFNAGKFDKDGEKGLDKFEFGNFKTALEVSIKQIIILDGLGAFSQVHYDSAEIGGYSNPDKWLAQKVDIQKHILGDKDSKTFTKQGLEKLGLNLTEEYYHKMEEKKFNPTDGKSWQELGILVGKEVGEGLESILRFFGNVPSGIVLLPRYLTYRERYIAYSMNKDIQKANEIEIKKNELVEQNISLALLEILGEKGIDMLKKLGEMVVSGKQGDIAMLLVTIAGILAGGAGLIKMGTRFTRRLAIKNARKVSRLGQNPILGQKGRGVLREVEKNAGKAEHTLGIVDNIVSTGGLAGVGHIVTKGIATEEVLRANARLSKEERILKAEELLQKKLTPENKKALLKAHNYKQGENVAKGKALMQGGFTREEAKILMDHGVAGVFDRFWGGFGGKKIDLISKKLNIEDIENFDDLYKYLEQLPLAGIQGSSKFYTSQELIGIIDGVKNGKLDINYITNSGGIRQKVEELLTRKKQSGVSQISHHKELGGIENVKYIGNIGNFAEIFKKYPQPKLTTDLLTNVDFIPQETIIINGKNYFMSKIIQTPNYEEVLMFFQNERNELIPRILYKSNSDGGWRSCPGSVRGTYSKGNRWHYTQETKPHQSILEYLNRVDIKESTVTYQGDLITEKFNALHLNDNIYTYEKEISLYNDGGILKEFQLLRPGYGFKEVINVRDYFKSLNFSAPGLKDFVPDFSHPIRTSKVEHTLLGETTLETFEAKLNGRKVEWTMAYDNSGRVWIDRIKFKDSQVNSYGIDKEVINSGLLTNKPIEYRDQTIGGDLTYARDILPFNDSYNDITPLLDSLEPIKKFRETRNIYRKSE